MSTSGVTPRATSAGSDVGGVARARAIERATRSRVQRPTRVERLVEAVGGFVEIARREAPRDPLRIDLDDERGGAVHRRGERLGAAHPAEPGGDDEPAATACRRNGGAPTSASVS